MGDYLRAGGNWAIIRNDFTFEPNLKLITQADVIKSNGDTRMKACLVLMQNDEFCAMLSPTMPTPISFWTFIDNKLWTHLVLRLVTEPYETIKIFCQPACSYFFKRGCTCRFANVYIPMIRPWIVFLRDKHGNLSCDFVSCYVYSH